MEFAEREQTIKIIQIGLEKIMDELLEIGDPILPEGIDIHLYEVQKRGNGWKILNYDWNNAGIIPVFSNNNLGLIKGLDTLPKLKNNYKDESDVLCCVIDGNLEAPSIIYQAIIECGTEEQKMVIHSILKARTGLNYNVMLEYQWVTDLPKDVVRMLVSY